MKSTLAVLAVAAAGSLTAVAVAQNVPARLIARAGDVAAVSTTNSLPDTFRSLVGEWEGTVQVETPSGGTAASTVSISNRLENDAALVSVFDGYSMGKRVQGCAAWRVSQAQSGSLEHLAFCSLLPNAGACAFASTAFADGSAISITGDAGGKTIRQVVRLVDDNRYIAEWLQSGADGSQTRVMYVDMVRLPAGVHSDAQVLFADRQLMARLDAPVLTTGATAGVDTEK
jgi:hypothetical protein